MSTFSRFDACTSALTPAAGALGHRAGRPRVRSRQADTIEEEATNTSASRRERAAKRGERSDFHSFNYARFILDLPHISSLYNDPNHNKQLMVMRERLAFIFFQPINTVRHNTLLSIS